MRIVIGKSFRPHLARSNGDNEVVCRVPSNQPVLLTLLKDGEAVVFRVRGGRVELATRKAIGSHKREAGSKR